MAGRKEAPPWSFGGWPNAAAHGRLGWPTAGASPVTAAPRGVGGCFSALGPSPGVCSPSLGRCRAVVGGRSSAGALCPDQGSASRVGESQHVHATGLDTCVRRGLRRLAEGDLQQRLAAGTRNSHACPPAGDFQADPARRALEADHWAGPRAGHSDGHGHSWAVGNLNGRSRRPPARHGSSGRRDAQTMNIPKATSAMPRIRSTTRSFCNPRL